MNEFKFSLKSGNQTPEIVDLLLNTEDNTRIIFDAGDYHFYEQGCFSGVFYPLSNKYGLKKVIFPVLNKNNIEIDGCGANFIFHDRIFPFILKDCVNVKLRNFNIDFERLRYFPAVVSGSCDSYVEFTFDESRCDFSVCGGHMICRIDSEEISSVDRKFFISDFDKDVERGTTITSIKVGECDLSPRDFPSDGLLTDARYMGRGAVRFYYRENSPRLHYYIGHRIVFHIDENRENDTFFADSCRDLGFQNVNIFRGPGMGLIAQLCENVTIDSFNIGKKDGRDELVSITADGFQFANCRGKVKIVNSVISDTLDDAMNLFGVYTHLERAERNALAVRFGHREQFGVLLYKSGDTVNIIDGKTLEVKESLTVEGARLTGGGMGILLQVRENIERAAKDDYVENITAMPELEFSNNTVHNCPSVLVSTPKPIRFYNNKINTRCAGLRLLDSPHVWYCSSRVLDAEVSENFFFHCGEGYDEPVIKIFEYGDRHDTADYIHKNIRIINNIFEGGNPKLLTVSHADGVLFAINKFKRTRACKFYDLAQPYEIRRSKNIVIKDNEAEWT